MAAKHTSSPRRSSRLPGSRSRVSTEVRELLIGKSIDYLDFATIELPGPAYQHAARPEFQTRFKWEEGSIAFWDNRATWHYALNDYQGERRLMHRITIDGVPLEPAL